MSDPENNPGKSPAENKPHAALPHQSLPKRKLPRPVVIAIATVVIAGIGMSFVAFLSIQQKPTSDDAELKQPETTSEFGLVIEPVELPVQHPTSVSPTSTTGSNSATNTTPLPDNNDDSPETATVSQTCPPAVDLGIGDTVTTVANRQIAMAGDIAALNLAINRIEARLKEQATARSETVRVLTDRLTQLAHPVVSKKKPVTPPFTLSSVSRWGQTDIALLATKAGPYSAMPDAEVSGWSIKNINFSQQQITVTRKNRSIVLSVEQ